MTLYSIILLSWIRRCAASLLSLCCCCWHLQGLQVWLKYPTIKWADARLRFADDTLLCWPHSGKGLKSFFNPLNFQQQPILLLMEAKEEGKFHFWMSWSQKTRILSRQQFIKNATQTGVFTMTCTIHPMSLQSRLNILGLQGMSTTLGCQECLLVWETELQITQTSFNLQL